MKILELKNIHWSKLHYIVRMLLAKVVYEGLESLSEIEYFLLFNGFERLLNETNYDYVNTRRMQLLRLHPLFYKCNHCKNSPEVSNAHLPKEAGLLVNRGDLSGPHAYFGWVSCFNVKQYVRSVSSNSRKIKRVKRFIGVGYKDKGNMKIPHLDGTPSWQEVAGIELDLPQRSPDDEFSYIRRLKTEPYPKHWHED